VAKTIPINSKTNRSKVTNGKTLFPTPVDGRSATFRRFRDIYAQVTSDLGGDPSEAQVQVARRAAALSAWCEREEAKLVLESDDFDVQRFATVANSLRRLFEAIGMERKARDVTPSIDAYLGRA
jgi:hypothetical protein